MTFTWYVALQGKYIRTFLPVYVPRKTKFRNDLESPLAQGDAVLCPDTHVSPVKPLDAGGAGRTVVHLGTFYAPQSAACPRETVRRRAASWSISSAQREASGQTRSLPLNNRRLGAGVQPLLRPIAMRTTLRSSELERVSPAGWLVVVMITFFLLTITEFPVRHRRPVCVPAFSATHAGLHAPFLQSTTNRFLSPVTLKNVLMYWRRWIDGWKDRWSI